MPRLHWPSLLGWAALGLVVGLAILAFNYQSSVDQLGGLVDTTPADSSVTVIGPELGPDSVHAGGFHDGHYYYLIARAPMHLDASLPYLDWPAYRLGRPALPWLAWMLHPSGGGLGLMWAMFAVGLIGVVAGAIGMGALSVTFGGKPWPAVIFPMALGSVLSLRISVPDPMAMGFALCALALFYRRHLIPALLLAVLAVLSKESALLVFLGVLIPRRDRDSALLLVVPGVALVAWQVWLRLQLGSTAQPQNAFGYPFVGLYDSVRFWLEGGEPLGMVGVVVGVGLSAAALVKRRLDHPLSWVLVLQCAFLLFLTLDVLGPERNGPRAVLPMTVLAVVMLATPRASAVLARAQPATPITAAT